MPEGKLSEWYDIKRRILEPAIKQINENPEAAGFSVIIDEFKEGRAVDLVRFTLTKTAGRLEEEKALKPKALDKPKTAVNSGAFVLPTSAYEQAKKVAPGWDIYELERQWREWIQDKPKPDTFAGSFVGFCKSKGRHQKFNR